MANEHAIVVDVPNTIVRQITYTYLGPKSAEGNVIYDVVYNLHPDLDTVETLPNGDHLIVYAKDKSRIIVSASKWISWSEITRPAKKTVLADPAKLKPTVVN